MNENHSGKNMFSLFPIFRFSLFINFLCAKIIADETQPEHSFIRPSQIRNR
jgi:hypothetical protein